MLPVSIYPAGGFAREVASMLPGCGYRLRHFYDDAPLAPNVRCVAEISEREALLMARGDSRERKQLYQHLPGALKLHFPSLIHPRSILQDQGQISIARGCIIAPGSILTTNISTGKFCLINLNCTIGHDVIMGDFCSLMPSVNLSGGVVLEDAVYIGSGATVLPGLHLGEGCTVGAGALVTKDVPAGATVVGVPGRCLEHSR